MKLSELKKKIQKYQYFENTDIIDVSLATIISNRLQLGKPVWMIIIGASSGGKSQIINPLSLTGASDDGEKPYIYRIDDLTENTFLSGIRVKDGDPDPSLLFKIGKRGILSMSDITVLFSRNAESKNAILSQFRMIYDGEMTKATGNGVTKTWQGSLGVIAGSTPSVYGHFEEVADMGERFIYYRMKDYDAKKATHIALNRVLFGKELDEKLSMIYDEYIKEVVKSCVGVNFELSEATKDRITDVAVLAERMRTTTKLDWKEEHIKKLPIVAFPMRVAIQLSVLAKGLMAMKYVECGEMELGEKELHILDWCAYSLGNEEKRAVLDVLAKQDFGHTIKNSDVANVVGLGNNVISNVLQELASIGLVLRTTLNTGSDQAGSFLWSIKTVEDWNVLRRINEVKQSENIEPDIPDEDYYEE